MMPRIPKTMTEAECVASIYARIIPEPNSGCWLWLGAHSANDYGTCRYPVNGINKVQPVHRVVYQIERGPIREGKSLDHLCRTPACVNPDHLEPVSHKENLRRGVGAKRSKERMAGNQHWKARDPAYWKLKRWGLK